MEWIKLQLQVLRSEQYIGSEPKHRAAYINLLGYCVDQENSGVIVNCKDWKDRKWMQICGVMESEVTDCELFWYEAQDLHIYAYTMDEQISCQSKREKCKNAALTRWERERSTSPTDNSTSPNPGSTSPNTESKRPNAEKSREEKSILDKINGDAQSGQKSSIDDEIFLRKLKKYIHMHTKDMDLKDTWDLQLFEACSEYGSPIVLQVAGEAFKKRTIDGEQNPKIFMEQLVMFLEQKTILEQDEDDPAQTHAHSVLAKGTGIALWDDLGSEKCLGIAGHHGFTLITDPTDGIDTCYQFKQWYRKKYGGSGHNEIQQDFLENLIGSYEHGVT